MRPSLLASLLLLLCLILTKAQGSRFGKGFISSDDKQNKIHEEEEGSSLIKTSNGGGVEDHEAVHDCKDGHCSSGMYRKLMTKTTSTTTTTSKNNVKKGGKKEAIPDSNKGKSENEVLVGKKEENFSVNSSPVSSEHREAAHEPYPDIIDIAGMDYSPARRKSPIHN